VCENEGQMCHDPNESVPDNWQCVCPQDGVVKGEKAPADCGDSECRLSLCANGANCPHDDCADQGQICVDPSMHDTDDWYCYGNATVGDRPSGEDDDDCDDFLECWWWLILLILLLFCSCCILLLLLIKRKQTNTDRDETKWNREFQAQNEDLEELIEGELDEREEYKGKEKGALSESLLAGSTAGEDEL